MEVPSSLAIRTGQPALLLEEVSIPCLLHVFATTLKRLLQVPTVPQGWARPFTFSVPRLSFSPQKRIDPPLFKFHILVFVCRSEFILAALLGSTEESRVACSPCELERLGHPPIGGHRFFRGPILS